MDAVLQKSVPDLAAGTLETSATISRKLSTRPEQDIQERYLDPLTRIFIFSRRFLACR